MLNIKKNEININLPSWCFLLSGLLHPLGTEKEEEIQLDACFPFLGWTFEDCLCLLMVIVQVLHQQHRRLTSDRSSQQAAHVQEAACGFRIRSCPPTENAIRKISQNQIHWIQNNSLSSVKKRVKRWEHSQREAKAKTVTTVGCNDAAAPEWGTAGVSQRIWCSSSSLCCWPFQPALQTRWGWTTAGCVWCSALCPLNTVQHHAQLDSNLFRKDRHAQAPCSTNWECSGFGPAHLIPVCSCKGHRWCSCSEPAARCCTPKGPSYTWNRSLSPEVDLAAWVGFVALSKRLSVIDLTLVRVCVNILVVMQGIVKHTHTWWCDGSGGLEASSLHDAAVSVDNDQRGLLGAEAFTKL